MEFWWGLAIGLVVGLLAGMALGASLERDDRIQRKITGRDR